MTDAEIKQLLKFTLANFPSYQERDMLPTAELWRATLSDMPFNVAKQAIVKVLSTSRFFPTVADIREAAVQITQPRKMEAMEAWELIASAIRRFGFMRKAEAMAALPEDVARAAEMFGWKDLCHGENVDTMKAQFRMMWEKDQARVKEMAVLPESVRMLIESNGVKRIEG